MVQAELLNGLSKHVMWPAILFITWISALFLCFLMGALKTAIKVLLW